MLFVTACLHVGNVFIVFWKSLDTRKISKDVFWMTRNRVAPIYGETSIHKQTCSYSPSHIYTHTHTHTHTPHTHTPIHTHTYTRIPKNTSPRVICVFILI